MIAYDYINSKLTEEEILCQLAEEAAELAQAALKLIRAKKQTNVTPVTVNEATDKLLEEMADVQNARAAFMERHHIDESEVYIKANEKRYRWEQRLKEAVPTEPSVPTEPEPIVKTILDDFLEKYPKSPLDDEDGTPEVCPTQLGYEIDCSRMTCKECWSRPLNEVQP